MIIYAWIKVNSYKEKGALNSMDGTWAQQNKDVLKSMENYI